MSENDNEKIYLRNNIPPSSCPLPPQKKKNQSAHYLHILKIKHGFRIRASWLSYFPGNVNTAWEDNYCKL